MYNLCEIQIFKINNILKYGFQSNINYIVQMQQGPILFGRDLYIVQLTYVPKQFISLFFLISFTIGYSYNY